MTPTDPKIKEIIVQEIKRMVPEILQGSAFTDRKLTDSPTDNLSVVNRRYVNLNGTLASRPTSSVATMGQSYFATDTNIKMTYNQNTSVWVSNGSVVAQG